MVTLALFSTSAQGLSADPIFLVENISELPQNKIQEIKKLLAKSLNKKISVEKVADPDGKKLNRSLIL